MPHTASLTIDLTPHIERYHAYIRGDLTSREYNKSKLMFTEIIDHGNAQLTWEDLVTQATQDMHDDETKALLESAAHSFFNMEFDEIVKNSIDACLAPHEHALQSSHPTTVTLTLDIETNDEEVTLSLSDNGPGFPDDYKNNSQTKEARENSGYFSSKGSAKASDAWNRKGRTSPKKEDFLFGGGGRGLKELAALVDHGSAMKGQDNRREITYQLPRVSTLVFDNKSYGHGAVVSITTTKEPLRRFEMAPEDITSRKAETKAPNMEFVTLPSHIKKRQEKRKKDRDDMTQTSPDTIIEGSNSPSSDNGTEEATSEMRRRLNILCPDKEDLKTPSTEEKRVRRK